VEAAKPKVTPVIEAAKPKAAAVVEAAKPKAAAVVEAAKPKAIAVVEAAKPKVAKGAERILEAAQTSPNGRKKAAEFTGIRELRKALDDAIADGKQVPHDKPLVTRLI
jgi:F0F1-type ATP synthase membrane subunit b/b'